MGSGEARQRMEDSPYHIIELSSTSSLCTVGAQSCCRILGNSLEYIIKNSPVPQELGYLYINSY